MDGAIGGTDSHTFFNPSGPKAFRLTLAPRAVHFTLDQPATACGACGNVWTQVDPAELARVLATWQRGDPT